MPGLVTIHARRAGLLLPLFSLRTRRDWGIGEIGDLGELAGWLGRAGQGVLQLLPLNELPDHETSPYSALSGMAIDPRFISLELVPDFQAVGGEASLTAASRDQLADLRAASRVRYAPVRALKAEALTNAYRRFVDVELSANTARAVAFRAFVQDQAWWLEGYALFRALRDEQAARPWTEWPPPLRDRDPVALATARARLRDEIRYRQYLQWLADDQWRAARRAADGVAIFGDLPFMVALDSADVWERQGEFRLDASLGVPPDAFSETGQDWNLPVYRWDVMEAGGFEWLTSRARRNASLFDGYRVDHLVGFFRTFFREPDGASGFTPAGEARQRALGERILSIFLASGATIVAEDLGVVPDFVRASMARLDVPGCKVFRWERHWTVEGHPFVDPADYPTRSVAVTGTHDTEPMTIWWRDASPADRAAAVAVAVADATLRAGLLATTPGAPDADMTPIVRDALLEAVYAARSDLVIVPLQDAFGWADRINTPAVVDDVNWTWRLPWRLEEFDEQAEAVSAAARLLALAKRHRRA
ncbi:MAG TPA: 4-alpha-glucanotransferase [Vicinamibacterales bacterium]